MRPKANTEHPPQMFPRSYAPFIYGIIQSGMTTAIATALAVARQPYDGFVGAWVPVWLFAWVTILPIVVGASPLIQRAVDALTQTR